MTHTSIYFFAQTGYQSHRTTPCPQADKQEGGTPCWLIPETFLPGIKPEMLTQKSSILPQSYLVVKCILIISYNVQFHEIFKTEKRKLFK